MKYLKRFENTSNKYKVGDYVLFDLEKFMKWCNSNNTVDRGDITEHNLGKIVEYNEKEPDYPYHIEFSDGKIEQTNMSELIRFLTPNEIEEYESMKSANKYNL